MIAYIAKRIAYSVFALVGVSAITFFAVFMSGDPAMLLLPPDSQSPAELARFRQTMGLDRPLPICLARQWTRLLLAAPTPTE